VLPSPVLPDALDVRFRAPPQFHGRVFPLSHTLLLSRGLHPSRQFTPDSIVFTSAPLAPLLVTAFFFRGLFPFGSSLFIFGLPAHKSSRRPHGNCRPDASNVLGTVIISFRAQSLQNVFFWQHSRSNHDYRSSTAHSAFLCR